MTLTDSKRTFYNISIARVRGLQSAWIQRRTRSTLPGDGYVLSGNVTMLDTLYTALCAEFSPRRCLFSADRAPNAETRHYSSVAICIRSLLPLQAMNVPILGPAMTSLLSLYYGRLHGDSGLIEVGRSSYTIALSQYHRHLEAFMIGRTQTTSSKRTWICASVVLQFFEHIDHFQVFDVGHRTHIDGALKVLEVCGPELLQGCKPTQAIFGSLLAVATFLGIHRRQPNVLSEERWRQVRGKSDPVSLRDELLGHGLAISDLLSSADKLLEVMQNGDDMSDYIGHSLHLLTKFDHLQTNFADWLNKLRAKTPGPLYWPSGRPTTFATSLDDECAPKYMDDSHQIRFSYGTIAGLLVQLWAFQLELLMTSIDLRRTILQYSTSAFVQVMISGELQEELTAADEKARLILEAQIYLESCLEGFICLQLPLRSATRYFQRSL